MTDDRIPFESRHRSGCLALVFPVLLGVAMWVAILAVAFRAA